MGKIRSAGALVCGSPVLSYAEPEDTERGRLCLRMTEGRGALEGDSLKVDRCCVVSF